VLRVAWMFELLLQMNESTRGLNQSLEKLGVGRFGIKPKLFQHVVRLVVLLFVPAAKERAIIRMIFYVRRSWVYIFRAMSEPL